MKCVILLLIFVFVVDCHSKQMTNAQKCINVSFIPLGQLILLCNHFPGKLGFNQNPLVPWEIQLSSVVFLACSVRGTLTLHIQRWTGSFKGLWQRTIWLALKLNSYSIASIFLSFFFFYGFTMSSRVFIQTQMPLLAIKRSCRAFSDDQ